MLNASIMNNRRRNPTIATLCLAALSALSFIVASATARAKDAPAQVAAAAAKFDKDQYVVAIKLSGACSVGKECKAEISLKSKGDFHINDKYPIKFKAADPAPEGVTFSKAVVKREDGKIGEKEGTLPVAFTMAKAGKAKISGQLSVSFCSDANCLMEKLELEFNAEAK